MKTLKEKLKKIIVVQIALSSSTFIWTIVYFWIVQNRRIDRATVDDFALYVVVSFILTFSVFYIVNYIGLKALSEKEIYESQMKCEYAIEQLDNKKCISRKKHSFLKYHVERMKEGKLLCPVILYLLNAYDWLRPTKRKQKG